MIRYGGEDVPQSPVHFVVKDEEQMDEEEGEAGPYRLSGQGIQRAQVRFYKICKIQFGCQWMAMLFPPKARVRESQISARMFPLSYLSHALVAVFKAAMIQDYPRSSLNEASFFHR